jgi:hypothetical protein
VNLAGVAGGAVPSLVAGTLQATYGSTAIGLMLAMVAAVSLVCTYLLPETNGIALNRLAVLMTHPWRLEPALPGSGRLDRDVPAPARSQPCLPEVWAAPVRHL